MDEREKLLEEMRAIGARVIPLAAEQTAPKSRPNYFDDVAREWFRSRTFKTILIVSCSLMALPFIVGAIFMCAGILLGAYTINDLLSHYP